MRRMRAWLVRLTDLFNKRRREQELADEIETNIELQIEDNIRAGMTAREARRSALMQFGSIDAAKEAVRDRRGISFVETAVRDVTYAFRMMRRNKGWTIVAVMSLALAIGVNTALFSILSAAVLAKLPVPNPDELIALRWAGQNDLMMGNYGYGYTKPDSEAPGPTDATLSFGVFEQLRTESRELADLFALAPAGPLNVVARGEGDLVLCEFVSGGFYSALGVLAERGRVIVPDDDRPSADPVIVMSREYWQRRFGADPAVIGTPVTINGIVFTIAGVADTKFGDLIRPNPNNAGAADIWIPLAMEPRLATNQSMIAPASWSLNVMGRLRPNATRQQLQARLDAVFQNAAKNEWTRALTTMPAQRQASFDTINRQAPHLRVKPGNGGVYDLSVKESGSLYTLGAVFGTVLLIVCVNLANLMLSRTANRQREIAVRVSIGATRRRLLMQLLTESMVVAVIGGGLGLLVAYWSKASFPVWLGFKRGDMDWPVVAFAIAVTCITGILFGILPALRGSRIDCATAVRAGAGQVNPSRSRLSRSLVVAQVALSLVLMTGAGLFLRTLSNLQLVDVGFDPNNMLVFEIDTRLYQGDPKKATSLYSDIARRLETMPGIHSVSLSSFSFLSGAFAIEGGFQVEGQSGNVSRRVMTVDANFFQTMGIALKLGREFTSQDNEVGLPVIVINEAFAKEFFPGENAIGRHIRQGATQFEIVGVVADTKSSSLRDAAPSTLYFPHLQRLRGPRTFEVRTAGDPASIVPAIRQAVHDIDPKIPLRSISTQMETIRRRMKEERLFAFTSSLFGMLALMISMVGLFGLMSYAVAQRTKEIGIRISLGARPEDVLRSVLGEALILVSIGIVIGLAVTLASMRFIAARLFGLAPHDPMTIFGAVLIMLLVAVFAAYLPARRAASVDPLIALRYE